MYSQVELLLMITLLGIGLIVWWHCEYRRKQEKVSKMNQPILPQSLWLKPFVYILWLISGFWKEDRVQVSEQQQPKRFWLARLAFWWLFIVLTLLWGGVGIGVF